jgi:hypothetical protein
MVWPFDLKKSRKDCRISALDFIIVRTLNVRRQNSRKRMQRGQKNAGEAGNRRLSLIDANWLPSEMDLH